MAKSLFDREKLDNKVTAINGVKLNGWGNTLPKNIIAINNTIRSKFFFNSIPLNVFCRVHQNIN